MTPFAFDAEELAKFIGVAHGDHFAVEHIKGFKPSSAVSLHLLGEQMTLLVSVGGTLFHVGLREPFSGIRGEWHMTISAEEFIKQLETAYFPEWRVVVEAACRKAEHGTARALAMANWARLFDRDVEGGRFSVSVGGAMMTVRENTLGPSASYRPSVDIVFSEIDLETANAIISAVIKSGSFG